MFFDVEGIFVIHVVHIFVSLLTYLQLFKFVPRFQLSFMDEVFLLEDF